MTTPQSGAYSFLDVQASITGPGGSFDIASSGVADEGIRIDMTGDKNTMTVGANGDGMLSLRASKAGRITVTLLKTGQGNALMNQLYSYQSVSSANWGQNIITVTNPVSGDQTTAQDGAFVRQSPLGYTSEGGMCVWTFDFVDVDEVLGNNFQNTGISNAA
jgi:hypothetical protein